MKFTEAVNVLEKRFGRILSNERLRMLEYVVDHPKDKLIAEAFDVYIEVVGMPPPDEEPIDWSKEEARSKLLKKVPADTRKKYIRYKKWFMFDTWTGEKKEFESSKALAEYLNFSVATVQNARRDRKMISKRYKIAASR